MRDAVTWRKDSKPISREGSTVSEGLVHVCVCDKPPVVDQMPFRWCGVDDWIGEGTPEKSSSNIPQNRILIREESKFMWTCLLQSNVTEDATMHVPPPRNNRALQPLPLYPFLENGIGIGRTPQDVNRCGQRE
ncbi:hypothetical protein AVEN_19433-1 [Araneus ventricosus]|uniref:Uncharacterized protein n=1 Tax=Araneus ventricosus TaxID=182803 RepID=A0A4Y2C7W5_ARAVE|nr:hypothetical protein AVEN_19433-1 [Araneus ventricosus]